MIGWGVARAWAVACRPGDWSQQPTWPHVSQSRRWTQSCVPIARQSSHPHEPGSGLAISSRWMQVSAMPAVLHRRRGLSHGRERKGLGGVTPGYETGRLDQGGIVRCSWVTFRRWAAGSATLVALACLAPLAAPGPASAALTWAPSSTATIHPGVQMFTAGSQCTAKFVYYDGTNVYVGQAAHCSGTGGNTETNGCTSGTLPVGTQVDVDGASKPGVMVYNSWITMQRLGEKDANTCQYNDLALVKLDPSDVASVNPSVPHWGGPVGLDTTGTTPGEKVYSYGNSELRGGVSQTSPKEGTSQGDTGAGWSHTVMTYNPGIPGDSGSGFLDATGNALGVLSTIDVGFPTGVTNGVGDLAKELSYLHAHESSFASVQLVDGTDPFQAGTLPGLGGLLGGLGLA